MANNKLEFLRPGFVPAIVLSTLLAVLIGCGGGGGGTTTVGGGDGGPGGGIGGGIGGTVAGNTVSGATTAGATNSGGILAANTIYYGSGLNSLNKVNPDGTGVAVVGTSVAAITTFASDPSVANQFLFSFTDAGTGKLGLYRNTTLSLTGATQIVAPTYDSVYSLQVSPDGSTLYFVADVAGDTTKLRKVAKSGGAPVVLDDAQTCALNFSGDTLVYEKLVGSFSNIFKRGVADSAVPVRLTKSTARNDYRPQWNKQGNRVIYISADTVALADVFSVNSEGNDVRQLTNTIDLDEFAASYNDDSTKFVTTVGALDLSQSGLYVSDTSGTNINRTFILPVPNTTEALYWSSNLGRSKVGGGVSWSKLNPAVRSHLKR